ncbi:hypothetical protein KAT36_03445 [Candidatus Pacearchaeota archaeon]|nr:hypothetical protein [Candidatus Pacearchaeota archaeon]
MKKDVMLVFLLLLSSGFTLAETACDLDVTLLNQDPYPAVPGDYVKLVFQIEGLDSPDCNDITFNLLADYPIEFNPGESGLRTFKKVDYIKDYETNLLIPYEVRINEDALDGANPIEVRVQSQNDAPLTKTFNIEVDDVRANFEIYVKDYDYATHELTLEVLNIAEADVEALTIEIPKQGSINIKGANRVVVGDLDSNEYTTAEFEAVPSDGEFKVNMIYSDIINTRRSAEETVNFDSSYFTDRKADKKTIGIGTYIFWAVIVLLIGWWGIRKFQKKKKK